MKPSEVIGRLLAYESRKAPSSTPKKPKGIALKASKEEKEEKKIDSDEDLALFLKRFDKVMKFRKKGFGSKGHFSPECANHNDKKKGKVMAATWSGGSDDSNERDESSGDEDLMANFLAFASSHKSKSANEKEEKSQEENDSSEEESDSSSNSINGYMEKSEQVERSNKIEDKLRDELALSMRNEEGLKREIEEANGSMTRMTSSTQKLDRMLSVGNNMYDKRGIRYEDGKEISTSNKTVFVKSLGNKEASPMQTPKKIDLGQCSNSAKVKVAPKRQPQAPPTRALQANIPQHMAHKGKGPIL
ncbi:hypothetical protein LWI29_036523 [Acer saccharum]|uniref:Uncharacterized protein n=1 Tax=Acer saccharum TaxID=4024 RepID=A0AA39SNU9_ACESA|nr:hypothetical protein LWI29_036523 [Acer saccharum]